LLLLVIVIGMVGVGLYFYRNRQKSPEPVAGLAVQAPDPVAITESEPAKAPAESSRIEAEAEAKLAAKRSAAQKTPDTARATPPLKPEGALPTADLALACTPEGASVRIDNQERQERTPFTAAGLSPGEHILVFTKTGYVSQVRTVELIAGKKASVTVNLKAAPITLDSPGSPLSQ
jgi:hypothetical protein